MKALSFMEDPQINRQLPGDHPGITRLRAILGILKNPAVSPSSLC